MLKQFLSGYSALEDRYDELLSAPGQPRPHWDGFLRALAAREGGELSDTLSLTERESEVLLRVAKGFTLPEIGVQLNLSRHTIADYVKQIYRKLNVSSRAEAALEAQRLGLFGRSR